MTLYELTDQFRELLSLMEDPDIDPQVIEDTMEGLSGEIEDKAEGYAIVLKELQAERDKFDTEVKRMSANRDRIDGHIKRMKESLLNAMHVMGVKKIQTEHFRISEAGNGGQKPLKITGDVPEQYQIIRRDPDMAAIRGALDEGKELDFAHLEERGTHLNIK